MLSILHFNFHEFASRNFKAAIFHNSAMLPTKETEQKGLTNGVKGLARFLIYNEAYAFKGMDQKIYSLSNNQFMAIYLIVFSLLLVLSVVAVVIRKAQKVDIEAMPVFLREKGMVFLYLYAVCLTVPLGVYT